MWSEEADFGGQVTLFGLYECGQRKLTLEKRLHYLDCRNAVRGS